MKREFSTYLDLLRFLAALAVFGSHLTFAQFTGGYFSYQGKLAGEGVAAFFVLSGYVIAYVSDAKERTLKEYATSRLARIYSVAFAAVILAVIVDLLALHYHWVRNVPRYQYHSFPKYLLLALTFSGQLGPLHESTFGAYTFWSLDYEVWYYLVFACAVYLVGAKKYLIVPVLLLIMAPRPLIDFPMWLLGVYVYYVHKRFLHEFSMASVTFFASLGFLVAYRLSGLDTAIDNHVNVALGGWPMRSLANSREFASQYISAMLVGVTIFSAKYMHLSALRGPTITKAVNWFAGMTFTLYLTQRSLLDLFSNAFPYNPHNPFHIALLIMATFTTVWLLAQITERKKLWWRSVFKKLFNAMPARKSPVTARTTLAK